MQPDHHIKQNTASVIMNTSGNLLGFCLIVTTSLKIADKIENSFIDEIMVVVSVLLLASCVCCYITLRRPEENYNQKLQHAADYLFFFSLLGILISMVLIAISIL